MGSTFTKREIYEERVVKEHVTTIILVRRRIMGDHLARVKGTQVTSEILADILKRVIIWLVFV
jgi:hypothetical protein